MANILLEPALTSTITGKLQTTIPALFARKRGIKTGMRLEWMSSDFATFGDAIGRGTGKFALPWGQFR